MEKVEDNVHELLRQCSLLGDKHETLKMKILERALLNEKAINELNQIESEYKEILEKLRLLKDGN